MTPSPSSPKEKSSLGGCMLALGVLGILMVNVFLSVMMTAMSVAGSGDAGRYSRTVGTMLVLANLAALIASVGLGLAGKGRLVLVPPLLAIPVGFAFAALILSF